MPPKVPKDDSLNFELEDAISVDDIEMPLLSLSTDVKELIKNFIEECINIDRFYEDRRINILSKFSIFYTKFKTKLKDEEHRLNLKEDLIEHGLDGLGYASSWARQFVEFYSKLSWLDGYAKINLTAMQKILTKLNQHVFDRMGSHIYNKIDAFLAKMKIGKDIG